MNTNIPKLPNADFISKSNLILSDTTIRMVDGLYCLNDLHKASGGAIKYTPSRFLRNKDTQELIQAINERNHSVNLGCEPKTMNIQTPNMACESQNPNLGCEKTLKIVNGGAKQGVYACRELVYAYASWIDKRFYLMVLQVFDNAMYQASENQRLNILTLNLTDLMQSLSIAGRFLSVGGKQVKPAIEKEIQTILDKQQLKLELGE